MLCDGLMVGVGLVSELGGPPWATFGDGPLPYEEPDTPPFGPGLLPMRGPVGRLRNRLVGAAGRRFIFRDADQVYRRVRADLGLPAPQRFVLDELASPFLHLQGSTPGFEYPLRSLPEHMHFVGALRPDPPRDWTPPAWWPEVTETSRPVVLVSQGSIRPDTDELIVPAIRGLAGADVLVVVTTGHGEPADLVARLGGRAAVQRAGRPVRPVRRRAAARRRVRHQRRLHRRDTRAGARRSARAGRHDRGEGGDRRAHRVHRCRRPAGPDQARPGRGRGRRAPGAGRSLATAAAAGVVRAEMAGHDAGVEGAELLERLATTARPVLRSDLRRARATPGPFVRR